MVIRMLKPGTKAPQFQLKDKDGRQVRLSDFIGKKVALYFYPKDNTPGIQLPRQRHDPDLRFR